MHRRFVRALVLLLTLGVTAGAVWRATANEQVRGRARLATSHADALAADVVYTLTDLRASLHAYVAPGQGDDFWAARAGSQLAQVQARLAELDGAAVSAGHPLAAAFEALDRLTEAERRARTHVQAGQVRSAGDVIFVEARDLIDTAARDVSDLRQALARAASAREAGMANEQSLLAGGLMAAWMFALILLTPVPRRPAPEPVVTSLLSPAPAAADMPPAQAPAASPAAAASPAFAGAPALAEAPEDGVSSADLRSLAALCLDLSRVSAPGELGPLLERAAEAMASDGLIVWLADGRGRTLMPAAAHGYDDQVLARLGPVSPDADNLTASAFRTRATSTARAAGPHAAAVAVPLLSATGPSGVLSAEVRPEANVDRAAAIAGVVAAQLANLFPAPTDAAEPSTHAHA